VVSKILILLSVLIMGSFSGDDGRKKR